MGGKEPVRSPVKRAIWLCGYGWGVEEYIGRGGNERGTREMITG